MNNISKKLKTLSITSLLICFTGVSQTAYADIGLPDSPLFLGTNVPPNIFLALDDSGSMDWEIAQENFTTLTQGSNGLPKLSFGNFADNPSWGWCYTEPVADQNYGSTSNCQAAPSPTWLAGELESITVQNEAAMLWNFNFNVTFYNPTVRYTPWLGEDNAGVVYTDADPAAARINPYNAGVGTQNLNNKYNDYTTKAGTVDGFYPARYYVWTDTVADGVVKPDDTFTLVEILSSTPTYTGGADRTDCAAVPVCTFAEEHQNFANWFSYYRKRQYVLQRAVSELIDDSVSYMGLATLHDNNSVGTPIEDMTDQAKKDDLLAELSQMDSNSGTPLRELLDNVGKYFDDTDGSDAPSDLGFTNSSPILSAAAGGECQQNFVVLMTDGEWNGSTPSGVDHQDRNTANIYDGGPHADDFDDTVADVAMKYYKNDLSSLADNVPESTYVSNGLTYTDDNPTQHLVTYTVGFGLTGTGVITPADHDSATAPPPWTEPVNSATKLDDVQHAAFDGRGAFLSASNPTELIDGLNEALGDIDQRTSVSGSAIAINSTVLKTTSKIFQASFNSVNWTGELSAFSLNSDGTVNAEVWSVTDKLTGITDPDDRNIYTSVSTGGIAFDDNPANAELNTAIGTLTIGTGPTTYTAADLIHYISGDQSDEGPGTDELRERDEILGDIVSSSPISIGFQDLGYNTLPGFPDSQTPPVGQEGSSYGAFLAAKNATFTDGSGDPQTVVYVGANDGMFHAFHDSEAVALQGQELFAYIPSTLHGKLSELADPAYGHKFYVNGGHTIGDACIDNGSTCTWKSILVGALGEGGRTVFALDVTDPFSFASDGSDVLWEYNFDDSRTGTTNSGEMGFIKGAPQVVRLNNGKWGVVFANGYNSDSDTAQIFILDAEDGTEIAVIDTLVGDAANENGLATPLIIDEDGDRIADTIYAGDLFGNMFKFDISDSSENNWASVWEGTGQQNGVAEPLYQALDDNGDPQAITTKPTIVVNPEGGFNIIFGTGKYIETSDTTVLTPYQVETMYSIHDDDNDNNSSQVGGRSDLVEQTIEEEIDVTVGTDVLTTRVISENTIDYSGNSADDGWFMDALAGGPTPPALTAATAEGERIIADPLTRFGRAIFTTFIPPVTPCDVGGESVLMEIDALSGARLEDSVFDINGDGIIDDKDYVTDSSGNKVPVSGIYVPGTLTSPAVISLSDPDQEAKQLSGVDSETTTVLESTGGQTVGRQSWKQLK